MTTKTVKKLQIVRAALMSEITNLSFKLKNMHFQSELQDMVPLRFCEDVYKLCPSLENYPFLKINNIEPTLIYADKDYKEEQINAYKTGKLKIKEECLDMFSVDELYNVCKFLTELKKNTKEYE